MAKAPVKTTDQQFIEASETLLNKVEGRCDYFNDTTDIDIDNQRVGGMLTLTFEDGTQLVINLQKPLHEVWLATPTGGFHYRLRLQTGSALWLDTKTGNDFYEDLTQHVYLVTGSKLSFC
jgi:CyaY protein